MTMIKRSSTALGLFVALGLAACSDGAQDIAGPGAVPVPNFGVALPGGPTVVGAAPIGAYALGAVAFRNFYRGNEGDVYAGVVDLATGARRVSVNLNSGAVEDPGSSSGDCSGNWSSGTAAAPADNNFTFTWDKPNNKLVVTVTNPNVSCTLTFPNFADSVATQRYAGDVGAAQAALSNVTFLKFFVKDLDDASVSRFVTVDLAALKLDNIHNLGDINGTNPTATEKWVTNYDFDDAGGFTVSGTLKLGRTGSFLTFPNDDFCVNTACVVNITFGTAPPSNTAPTANAGGPYSGNEGSVINISGTAADADNDVLTTAWSFATGGAGCTIADASALNTSVTCDDNGAHTLRLTVNDGKASAVTSDATLTVNNVAPSLGTLAVSSNLVAINTPVSASGAFTDPGSADTHTGTFDWDDNSTSAATIGSGTASGSHTYTEPGVYTVSLTVTDDDTGSDTESFQYVVVYDPSAGFVTGGGWINSAAGAYKPDATLVGRANFGFISRYQKGAAVPTGNTEFQFQTAGLNFHSTSYQWLVVNRNGLNAQFKGVGRLNGVNGYKFMIWATDMSKLNGTTDTFRIQITDASDVVVYDNGTEQAIAGGSIVVHTGK